MRVKNLAVALTLVGVAALCFGAADELAQQSWYVYGPPPRYQATAVYNPQLDILIMFGGQHSTTRTGVDYNDLWWAKNLVNAACEPPCDLQWMQGHPSSQSPHTRFGHTAIYDTVNDRMTVFAGAQGVQTPAPCENDLWVLAHASGIGGTPVWSSVAAQGNPPGIRYSHTAVYDSVNNRMIVFGGGNCSSSFYNDVWVLTNANGLGGTPQWTQLSPSGIAPSARAFSSAVYDPNNNRMIVFGGSSGGTFFGDVWLLTNANGLGGTPVWTQLNPSGTGPSARAGQSGVYDPSSNRMVIYGGMTATSMELCDTWILTNANGLGGVPAWMLAANNANAPFRSGQSAIYNAATNQMFIFGGHTPFNTIISNPNNSVFAFDDANGL